MEQVAKQLGVSQKTVSNDLDGLVTVTKPSRPKGGRPKATKPRSERAPKAIEREEKVAALKDAGLTTAEIAVEVGLGKRAVSQALEHAQIKREAAAAIDPATLSMSAKEKYDAALRQAKRLLEIEFEQRVLNEVKRRINETVLPHFREKEAVADNIIKGRKGLMSRISYRKILTCLHSDRVTDTGLKKKYDEAFLLFRELELLLCDEKENPTPTNTLPRTYEELMARRKHGRRGANGNAVQHR